MMSQHQYLEHEGAQHLRVMGEYKDLLESHAKLRTDTTKVWHMHARIRLGKAAKLYVYVTKC